MVDKEHVVPGVPFKIPQTKNMDFFTKKYGVCFIFVHVSTKAPNGINVFLLKKVSKNSDNFALFSRDPPKKCLILPFGPWWQPTSEPFLLVKSS